jgi:hypothetical protein
MDDLREEMDGDRAALVPTRRPQWPTVYRPGPLVPMASAVGVVVAVAGGRLLIRGVRALLEAVVRWLKRPSARISPFPRLDPTDLSLDKPGTDLKATQPSQAWSVMSWRFGILSFDREGRRPQVRHRRRGG